jgi:hypothetical protein
MFKPMVGTCVVLGVSGLVACGDLDGVDDSIQTTSQSILNGTPVSVDSLGTPKLSLPGNGTCSATLLSDRWLLTAHHCATVEDVRTGGTPLNPASITATLLNGSSAKGAAVFLHPSVDVALVQLDASLLNGAGVPFANPLFLGSATSLVNGAVHCQGWGVVSLGQGSGVLRSATMVVTSASTSSFTVPPNNFSQVPAKGDSGGACFITIDGIPRVAGVVSVGAFDGNQQQDARLVSIDAFRDWAQGVMGNAATLFAAAPFAGRAQAMVPGPSNQGWYDYHQLLVGNDVVSSLTVPRNWSVTLYRDSGFSNVMQTFTSTTSYVGDAVNDRTSSVNVFGGVVLYRDMNLQQPIPAGTLSSAGDYQLTGDLNNSISSLTVPAGWRVQLFDGDNLTGASGTFNEGTYLFVGSGLNDIASSISIEQPVEVYVDPFFRGAVGLLLPGCYGWNAMGVPNDSMSSIVVPNGMSVQVFTAGQFTGVTTTFFSNQINLSSPYNNSISSICVNRT